MLPPIHSVSSGMMLGITLYRNHSGLGGKIVAELSYAVTAIVALVETVAATAFCALSFIFYPFSTPLFNSSFDRSLEQLKSSSFTIIWSLFDVAVNPIARVLVADEKSARWLFENRQFFRIPPGAII